MRNFLYVVIFSIALITLPFTIQSFADSTYSQNESVANLEVEWGETITIASGTTITISQLGALTVSQEGFLINNGHIILEENSELTNGGTIENNGIITVNGNSELHNLNGASITNNAVIDLKPAPDGGLLENLGTMTNTCDGQINIPHQSQFSGNQPLNDCQDTAPKDDDQDDDGIPDEYDECPVDPDNLCVDSDNDGTPDPNDPCPEDAEDLCLDSDNDGEIDQYDPCPNDPNNGCVDSDGDGIPDSEDPCKYDPINGCADTGDADNDGLDDNIDDCPNQPETQNGYQDSDGCPDSAPTKPTSSSTNTITTKLSATPSEQSGKVDLNIDFLNSDTGKVQDNIDYKLEILKNDKTVFSSTGLIHTSLGSVSPAFELDEGSYVAKITVEYVSFQPITPETTEIQFYAEPSEQTNLSDTDNDGILNTDDQCPQQAETYNGYQDKDGCPDTDAVKQDSDGDGIPDVQDSCVSQSETWNNYEDTDGCPDTVPSKDTDGDGIVDVFDGCIYDAQNTCTTLDKDGDGINDNMDKCPLERENLNNFEDYDGCPDKSFDILNNGADLALSIKPDPSNQEPVIDEFPIFLITITNVGSSSFSNFSLDFETDQSSQHLNYLPDECQNINLCARPLSDFTQSLYDKVLQPGQSITAKVVAGFNMQDKTRTGYKIWDVMLDVQEDTDTNRGNNFAKIQYSVGSQILDTDEDGIEDSVDLCVNQKEIFNGFDDSDGCPDNADDKDRDGVLDVNDECLSEKETRNGYQDSDGCPDTKPQQQVRVMPDYLGTTVGYWTKGQASDNEFKDALGYMIEKQIIKVSPVSDVQCSNGEIPSWIRDSSSFYAQGLVSPTEYLNSIEYLVNNGIISTGNAQCQELQNVCESPFEVTENIPTDIISPSDITLEYVGGSTVDFTDRLLIQTPPNNLQCDNHGRCTFNNPSNLQISNCDGESVNLGIPSITKYGTRAPPVALTWNAGYAFLLTGFNEGKLHAQYTIQKNGEDYVIATESVQVRNNIDFDNMWHDHTDDNQLDLFIIPVGKGPIQAHMLECDDCPDDIMNNPTIYQATMLDNKLSLFASDHFQVFIDDETKDEPLINTLIIKTMGFAYDWGLDVATGGAWSWGGRILGITNSMGITDVPDSFSEFIEEDYQKNLDKSIIAWVVVDNNKFYPLILTEQSDGQFVSVPIEINNIAQQGDNITVLYTVGIDKTVMASIHVK